MDKDFWRGTFQNYLAAIFYSITVALVLAVISWRPKLMQLSGLKLFILLFGAYLLCLAVYLYFKRRGDHGKLQAEQRINQLMSEIARMKAEWEANKPLLHWPHLNCGELRNVGFVEQNIYGAGLKVTNDELRYDSTAHNVRASIQLRHGSRQVDVSGAWFWYDGQNRFAKQASLGMQEEKWLLIFLWGANDQLRDFRAVNQCPPDYSSAQKLDEYGEWRIDVKLVGDNVLHDCKTSATLTRTGGIPGCS